MFYDLPHVLMSSPCQRHLRFSIYDRTSIGGLEKIDVASREGAYQWRNNHANMTRSPPIRCTWRSHKKRHGNDWLGQKSEREHRWIIYVFVGIAKFHQRSTLARCDKVWQSRRRHMVHEQCPTYVSARQNALAHNFPHAPYHHHARIMYLTESIRHLKADMDGAETAFTDAQDPVRCLMMRICVVSIELCRLTHCRAIVQ